MCSKFSRMLSLKNRLLITCYTRMHSSRMRTGRSLTVCCSLLRGEGGSSLAGGGVCLVWGGSPWSGGGVLLGPGGVFLGPGGVSAWSQGGFSLVRGGSPCRGVSAWSRGGDFSLVPGGCLPGPRGVLRRPPPVYRITDTCKNITLATTSLRPVNVQHGCPEETKPENCHSTVF